MTDRQYFQDKVVVITGASSGIGLACARHFGSQFVTVAIDARVVDGKWVVTTHGGRKMTGRELFEWAH